ncbi:PDR/VanB family oxidoreductase [uncultured Roseibium sp.]|uniref:PDR/VanB family oxidoreductase n=1 Tax=uncultured Roseibium sp. TaxID=1936171 RepID=UPI003216379C
MTSTLDLTIVALRRLSARIALIELRAAEGAALPAFTAGAHLPVNVPGVGRRQYSLVNDPAETHRYCIAVARRDDGRGGSLALHRHAGLGTKVTAEAPVNLFPLEDSDAPVCLVGGGIGVTPLVSMAHRLWCAGRAFDLHCALAEADLPGIAEWLSEMPFAERVHFHGGSLPSARLDIPALAAGTDPATRIYVCGPGIMIAEAEATFGARDMAVMSERFTASGTEAETTGGFEIEIPSCGQLVCVAEGQSALEALRSAGVSVESSCEAGVCGSCRTKVLSGQLEHHDYVLTPQERAEGSVFMPCVSRGSGRIVADL